MVRMWKSMMRCIIMIGGKRKGGGGTGRTGTQTLGLGFGFRLVGDY